MEIVADTSALIATLLDEPERPALIGATRGAVLFAPASVPWEVGNALVALVRRRRLTAIAAADAWASFTTVPIRFVEVDIAVAIATAVQLGIYAYDAYILVLARDRGVALLTLDQRLRAAAAQAHIQLVEY